MGGGLFDKWLFGKWLAPTEYNLQIKDVSFNKQQLNVLSRAEIGQMQSLMNQDETEVWRYPQSVCEKLGLSPTQANLLEVCRYVLPPCVEDCEGVCVDDNVLYNWPGDGACDWNTSWGINLRCAAWDWDGGDCEPF